ncbi:MAG: hypothetical protein IJN70_07370 [Clostridia bacterium]|nr:hypothetical protein [Clostridia bacterium]
MKTSKRFLALVLSALMIFSVVIIPGADLSLFGVEADAAVTLGDITQQRVVSNYESLYDSYRNKFFTGRASNQPTNFVIPGLSSANDYTPQGMTYWKAKEWILISAYDASGAGKNSVVYAIDAVTTDFVALFRIFNANGTINTSHGGGIAASEYNFYYADSGSKISYVPLSEMDVAVGTVKDIKLVDSINCAGEMNTAYTSYCCYDDGVLWTGNFYLRNDNYDYNQPANASYNSMLLGYKLAGNSSAEEWYYLSENYNLVKLNYTTEQTAGTITYTSLNYDGANASIYGKVTTDTALGEATASFATVTLTEGVKYKIEFIADNRLSDMYMFAPNGGGHCNVKQSVNSTITDLGDGRYHYKMVFTAGLKPAGADSLWPATQSTNGTYTGTYTIRFDQDSVPVGGREFTITDFSITEYTEVSGFTPDSKYEGIGCEGNPTYAIAIDNTYDKIQYAMVDKGKIYMSRSWSRNMSGSTHVRALAIADIDIFAPGTESLTVNGRIRKCHIVKSSDVTQFGIDKNTSFSNKDILAMGEALCIMNDYLYMFAESAAWNYNGKDSSSVCAEPVDVIWKIDQYAIMGEERPVEEVSSVYYKKVTDLSQIQGDDSEYIVVFESEEKDPVTQKNILYALDSFGGYGKNKLPKQNNFANTGDSMGIIGYPITNYSTGTITEDNNTFDVIYLNETDDSQKSIRWNLIGSDGTYQFKNRDFYYNVNSYLTFNERCFAMSNAAEAKIAIAGAEDGRFYIACSGKYLWCNDDTIPGVTAAYNKQYSAHGITDYLPVYNGEKEVKGTFHSDALTDGTNSYSGNVYGPLSAEQHKYGMFNIYKKVNDPYSSTAETRVFTDMNAELQADGTYTVRLETYATSPVQYQTVAERPTDFIIAIDNSTTTFVDPDKDNNFNGFHRHNSFDLEAAAGTEDAAGKTNNSSNSGTWGYYGGNMWVQHEDGVMCNVKCNVQGDGRKYEFPAYTYYQRIYLYYVHPKTGITYWFHPNSSDEYGVWTTEQTTHDQAMRIGASSKADRAGRNVFRGVCYEKRSNSARLSNMQIAANQLIWNIEQNIIKSGLDHRIAIMQFSSPDANSGIYTTTDNALKTYYGTLNDDHYKNAFYTRSQFNAVKDIVNNKIQATGGGTQPLIGINMANGIARNSDASYFADGNRSVCLIMLTDGASLTETSANDAIAAASNTKQTYGAYIYTIRVAESDFDVNGVDVSNVLDYISSDFLFAKSLTNPGEKNVKPIDFSLSVQQFDSTTAVDNFVDDIYESVTSNSVNALAKLNINSIIREQIADVFYTTEVEKENIKTYTANSHTDGLDRIYFETPVETSDITVDKDRIKDEKTITATGFNYTENYVDSAHDGKKLIIEISGLLANPNYEFNNENITVHDNTAIYQNQNFLNKQSPIKHYPQENFTIPEYTYVLDYGIGMLDTDVNGTLKSISRQPTKQSEYVGHLVADNVSMNVTNNWLDLVYGLKPVASMGVDNDGYDHSSGYCLIQRDNGKYDWFKINIKPASNVYFEEFIETNISSSDKGYAGWSVAGEKKTDLYQTLTGKDSVYGYDSNYLGDTSTYSYGSAYTSQVSSDTMRSETISFDYTGTAVDIVSSCGVDTGIYIVTIKNGTSVEKAYIVDTYFTDSNALNGVTQINQVPIVHHENANGYGTYTAEVTSVYLSTIVNNRTYALERFTNEDMTFFSRDITEEAKEAILQFAEMEYLLDEDIEVIFCDENSVLNGGTGVEGASSGMATFGLRSVAPAATTPLTNYFDGYRIYKPLGDNESDYVQTEQGSQYYNVIDSLVSPDDIINGSGTGFVGYVVGDGSGETDFAKYAEKGPANEVYLSNNNAVAFTAPEGYERVMVSLRAVNGSPKAKIGDKEFAITSNTEMYYDITDYIQNGTVTVQNSGTGLLAVNNIKLVSGHTLQPLMMFAMPRIRMMMAAPAEEVEPNLPVETPDEGGSWPTDIPYTEAFPTPEEPETTPDGDTGTEEEKDFIEQITENFTKLLNMIKSMLDTIVNLLKSIMA